MKKTNTSKLIAKQIALAAITVLSMGPVFFTAPAEAITLEPGLVRQLQDARGQLLRRENQLLRDQDDLRKQLDDLRKRNDGNVLSGTINELAKRLDKNYADLRQTRTAIRDVETNLL